MRKTKFAHVKRFAGVLCLLGIAVIFSACDIPPTNIEYTFNNESSYEISVTLNEIYKTKNYNATEDRNEYVSSESKTLSVSSGSESTVYIDSESVNFSWTSLSEDYNKNIYCVVSQNKATFKNRIGEKK